ncbi:hypothetical protein Syun_010445 [Stephania yunnanensis]|uniref:Secreted protein n=1 Tax=Stephania yunnanensis TaxID=152371 RepID=A0AAP0KGG3_9MAGN
MLDLAIGVMLILSPPMLVASFRNAGSICDWKLGLGSGSLMRRSIRPKNIELIQLGSCKVAHLILDKCFIRNSKA